MGSSRQGWMTLVLCAVLFIAGWRYHPQTPSAPQFNPKVRASAKAPTNTDQSTPYAGTRATHARGDTRGHTRQCR